jgi:DNA-binding MurR/RpiR family transcriptional regulator
MAPNHRSAPREQETSEALRSSGANQPSLQSRIHYHYGELPDSERKLADLILEFPGEIAAYTATELAELAGASKAAVTRLIRRLGYRSFEEERLAARDAKSWGSPVYLISKDVLPEALSTRVQKNVDQDIANLRRTFEGLENVDFESVIEALATSPRIWLLGYRNSHFLAGRARWQFIQVRGDVHLLPAAGETMAEYLADLQPDDLLIVVGFRRRMSEIDRAMEIAARGGTRVLYYSDPTARPQPFAT